jgi:hypothetical protein
MPADIEAVKLQLAMAFGQGAGAMLAKPDALQQLFTDNEHIITKAMADWEASQWAFTALVRLLGQLSAARAAAAGRAEIESSDIDEPLPELLGLCPCLSMKVRTAGAAS